MGGFLVKGRGEFQLVILIETLRREGLEIGVTRPEVIYKYKDGEKLEPIERLYVDCQTEYSGAVTDRLSTHKAHMLVYTAHDNGRVHLEFSVPARALIGYRDQFLTDTKGTGLMSAYGIGYEPYRGDFNEFKNGFLSSDIDSFISGLQGINSLYGKSLSFSTFSEFDEFMLDKDSVFEF